MKKVLIGVLVLFLCLGACFCGWVFLKGSPSPDYVRVDIEGSDEHPLTWESVNDLIQEFAGMGYMCVDINGLKWVYYCPRCDGVPATRRHDELVLQSRFMNVSAAEDWCDSTGETCFDVSFGREVEFGAVKDLVDMLNKRGFGYFLSTYEANDRDVMVCVYNEPDPADRVSGPAIKPYLGTTVRSAAQDKSSVNGGIRDGDGRKADGP